uniref:Putative glycine-rich cell wall structural protein n=1 Tax=Ixodes ricinus TaxID=34613 RepID=A0A147BAG8_IXORI
MRSSSSSSTAASFLALPSRSPTSPGPLRLLLLRLRLLRILSWLSWWTILIRSSSSPDGGSGSSSWTGVESRVLAVDWFVASSLTASGSESDSAAAPPTFVSLVTRAQWWYSWYERKGDGGVDSTSNDASSSSSSGGGGGGSSFSGRGGSGEESGGSGGIDATSENDAPSGSGGAALETGDSCCCGVPSNGGLPNTGTPPATSRKPPLPSVCLSRSSMRLSRLSRAGLSFWGIASLAACGSHCAAPRHWCIPSAVGGHEPAWFTSQADAGWCPVAAAYWDVAQYE